VQFDLVSWLIGITTKIGINWLSQWLHHKFPGKKRTEDDYFTITYSKGKMDFEGSVKFEGSFKTQISVEEIIQKFLESTKKEEKL